LRFSWGDHISIVVENHARGRVPHFKGRLWRVLVLGKMIAVFSISPVALISGSIPQRQQRLVEAWAELHQDELLSDWNLLQEGRNHATTQDDKLQITDDK